MNKKYSINNWFRMLALLIVAGGMAVPGQAQTNSVCDGEEVCLTLPTGTRGAIFWEESSDGTTWSVVSGQTNDTLCTFPTMEMWYRAGIVEGSCDTLWSDTTHILVWAAPTAEAGLGFSVCEGMGDTLMGSASGGTAPYTYSWSPSSGLSSTTVVDPVASPTTTTMYYLTVTDSNGCSGMDSVMVTVHPLPTVDAGSDVSDSCGVSTSIGGSPTASGSGGFSYQWSPGSGLSSTTVANPTLTIGNSTTYTVWVTDTNGCMNADSMNVTSLGGGSSSGTQTFSFTGAAQFWVVPCGVDSVDIDVYGAQGGFDGTTQGGLGGSASGRLGVTPNDTVWIYVGGQGTNGPGSGQNCNFVGGWNGGGTTGDTCCSNAGGGAGSGGGASDVRYGGSTLNDRVIVGGGGGGAGSNNQGASGGGLIGNGGGSYAGVASTGGTQTAGGQAGGFYVPHSCSRPADGTFGVGGKGDGNDGGGGGGGWYGGGGGANNNGGAGGSSYYGGVVGGSTSTGVRTGNGEVTLTW